MPGLAVQVLAVAVPQKHKFFLRNIAYHSIIGVWPFPVDKTAFHSAQVNCHIAVNHYVSAYHLYFTAVRVFTLYHLIAENYVFTGFHAPVHCAV